MQSWISGISTVTGDLLALAATVINLAAALAQRHPSARRRRARHREPDDGAVLGVGLAAVADRQQVTPRNLSHNA
jgi:hypothetical protein